VDAVDTGGAPTASTLRRYSAFGVPGEAAPAQSIERGFASRPIEGASGLVYMRARHYDPTTGRFLQPDPEGIASTQRYAFAEHNPYIYNDPTGRSSRGIGSLDRGVPSWAFEGGGVLANNSGGPFMLNDGPTLQTQTMMNAMGSANVDQGGQDYWTAGALTGATVVIIRNGFDASAFLGVTVGQSDSGSYGVTRTSAGYSLANEFGDFQRPGGSRDSQIRGIEFDLDWDPLLGPFGAVPFVVKGGPEALFDPGLVTTDYSFGFGTLKTFENSAGNLIGGALGLGFGLGWSRVEGGFSPIFVTDSPLE